MRKVSALYKRISRVGLRTVKTVLASVLAMLVCGLFPQMSPLLVLMGVYSGMGRTVAESWKSGLGQFYGVLVGSALGFLLLVILPYAPPLWMVALCLLPVILVCNLLKIPYAIFLSSVIFVSVCVGDSHLVDILSRIRDTAIGLVFGLGTNILIVPYYNEKRVYHLIRQLQQESLDMVSSVVLKGLYPDPEAGKATLANLRQELDVTRQQMLPFLRKKYRDLLVQENACTQLAERMLHEAQCLCSMDAFGTASEENLQQLLELTGEQAPAEQKNSPHHQRDAVTNYHLDCYLQAHFFLNTLVPAEKPYVERGKNSGEKSAKKA